MKLNSNEPLPELPLDPPEPCIDDPHPSDPDEPEVKRQWLNVYWNQVENYGPDCSR